MPPKDKGWRKDRQAAKPRPPAPQKKQKAPKRPAPASPQKDQGKKQQAVEASSGNESDGDPPAPAPAAAASEPTKKCSKCRSRFPQSSYSQAQLKKGEKRRCENCKGQSGGSRRPAKSHEIFVPIKATILTSKGEEKVSVPVPGDTRSVAVRYEVRIRKNKGDTPGEREQRAWTTWLVPKVPHNQWSIVDAVTGNRIGRCALLVNIKVDRTNGRATVTEEKVMETLRKQEMGAVSVDSFKPTKGFAVRRFLTGNAEKGLNFFCQAYLDRTADVLERV